VGVHRRARATGLLPLMGSIGDCYDNAMIESFWGRMQTELLNRRKWRTWLELAKAIFEYLEIFHNRQRRHSALGMLTRSNTNCARARSKPSHEPKRQQPDSEKPRAHQSLRTRRGDSVRTTSSPRSPSAPARTSPTTGLATQGEPPARRLGVLPLLDGRWNSRSKTG